MFKTNERELNSQSDLFDLMQNEPLSVIALQSFTLGYYTISRNRSAEVLYPRLEYMFYVLPIVYNHSSMLSFLNSNEMYTALLKEPEIVLGLQNRANKMIYQTFDALNLAFSKKILSIDKTDNTISLLRPFTSKKLLLSMTAYQSYDSVKKIQDSAFKLGCIFAKRHDKNIQLDLNIRF
jgi:ABC-3C biological conflict system middle component